MALSDAQSAAVSVVAKLRPQLSDFHQTIWSYAEPAWREYRSAAAYVDFLREEGFEVEAGSGDMPTAFHARWGDSGPAIGMYAEYDATPGYSQEPVAYRKPREGFHPWAPGFTDAHSALGVGALGGAVALKRTLQSRGMPGQIHFFGEPAEKVCGSKAVHAAKGYYEALDAAISYHPLYENTVLWDIQNCLYWSAVFTFQCTDQSPWMTSAADGQGIGSHNQVRSPGAVDALGLMLTATKYSQENMFPRTGLWSLNEVVLGAGNATADNFPPRVTQIQFSWRSPLLSIQEQILEVLRRNARHAAGLANCEVTMRWVTRIRPSLRNHAFSTITYNNLLAVGPQEFDSAAMTFGQSLEKALGREPTEDPFGGVLRSVKSPQDQDAEVRQTLPPWQDCTGADDWSEYSWQTPTARFFTAKPLLAALGTDMTHWANNAMNGFRATIDPCWSYASQVLASTAIELVENPEALRSVREEFLRNRDEGPASYQSPLLPSDFAPPHDLPWPEYVTTARGFEWLLPTTTDFGEPV